MPDFAPLKQQGARATLSNGTLVPIQPQPSPLPQRPLSHPPPFPTLARSHYCTLYAGPRRRASTCVYGSCPCPSRVPCAAPGIDCFSLHTSLSHLAALATAGQRPAKRLRHLPTPCHGCSSLPYPVAKARLACFEKHQRASLAAGRPAMAHVLPAASRFANALGGSA
jgi:hypothetical protein